MPPTFDSLPLDVHYLIFSYLSFNHTARGRPHPLVSLALASTRFRDLVESYTSHRLQYLFLRWPKLSSTKPILTQKRPLRSFLRYLRTYCTFCAVKTSTSATLYPYITCCRLCDKIKWPNKITLTHARKHYRLSREELIANVRHGECYCFGVLTTMFFEHEVRDYVERTKNGGMKALEEKKIARERANEMRKTMKENELRSMLSVNGIEETEFETLRGDLVSFSPRLVVRMEILKKRLESQHLERRRQDLRNRGYIIENGRFPFEHMLRPGPMPADSEDPYDEFTNRQVVAEALSEMFMAEFAGGR